jgi:DNA-binding response OmpR family regulator
MTETQPTQNLMALIIEDDPKLGTIFSTAFERADFQTEIIQDGRLATERLAVTTPEIVILDLHLPFVSGTDLLSQIRADERLAHTQVIVVTADFFKAETLRDKADLVLVKPIGFIQLQNLAANLHASHTLKSSK